MVWTWDLAVLGMLTRYSSRARYVQNDSAQQWISISLGNDTWGRWGLYPDHTDQRVWAEFWRFPKCLDVGDFERMFIFWTEFVFVVASGVCKVVWMCSMSEVPQKGQIHWVYYYYSNNILQRMQNKTYLVNKINFGFLFRIWKRKQIDDGWDWSKRGFWAASYLQ